jgi:HK97 family phage prohead protease
MKLERRFLSEPVAVEQVGDSKKIKGYAAKFNSRSFDLGGFVEEIDPRAFDRALREKMDCRALWNHDTNHVLGRVKSGTLELNKDSTGLHYSIVPPATQVAKDLMVSMERGDVDNSSFGFVCSEDSWSVEKDGTVVRRLMDVDLYDVSPVSFAAYPDAPAQVRSLFPESEGQVPEEIASMLVETRAKAKKEKRYRNVLGAVTSQRWAILPEKLAVIEAFLNKRAEGIHATDEEIRAALAMQHGDTPEANGVAVIPVYGVIAQRMSMFDDISGGTSCEAISKSLKVALADETVGTIVLDIDSPGGTVTGVPELAAEIYAARGKKPIIAVANGMAASAAYWIASAADRIVVTPSGEVGSIGVYTSHQDVSAMLEKEGVKITFIQAGKYKTDGNPYEPLSDEAKADIQDGVDKFYGMFTRGVAGGRGVSLETVLSDFGQGRMLLAEDAVAAGMADQIATLDQVLLGFAVAAEADESVVPAPVESEFQVAAQSAVEGVEPVAASTSDMCACKCEACMADDCEGCTIEDCGDPFCTHEDDWNDDDDDEDDELATLRLQAELKMREFGINPKV